jgi:hypothetical protein
MQRSAKEALIALALAVIAARAEAALIAYEGFDYPADPNGLRLKNGGMVGAPIGTLEIARSFPAASTTLMASGTVC